MSDELTDATLADVTDLIKDLAALRATVLGLQEHHATLEADTLKLKEDHEGLQAVVHSLREANAQLQKDTELLRACHAETLRLLEEQQFSHDSGDDSEHVPEQFLNRQNTFLNLLNRQITEEEYYEIQQEKAKAPFHEIDNGNDILRYKELSRDESEHVPERQITEEEYSEIQQEKAKALFDEIDNGNDILRYKELLRHTDKQIEQDCVDGANTEEYAEQLREQADADFKSIDKSDANYITKNEFLAHIDEKARENFAELDEDHTGKISVSEFVSTGAPVYPRSLSWKSLKQDSNHSEEHSEEQSEELDNSKLWLKEVHQWMNDTPLLVTNVLTELVATVAEMSGQKPSYNRKKPSSNRKKPSYNRKIVCRIGSKTAQKGRTAAVIDDQEIAILPQVPDLDPRLVEETHFIEARIQAHLSDHSPPATEQERELNTTLAGLLEKLKYLTKEQRPTPKQKLELMEFEPGQVSSPTRKVITEELLTDGFEPRKVDVAVEELATQLATEAVVTGTQKENFYRTIANRLTKLKTLMRSELLKQGRVNTYDVLSVCPTEAAR